jgi:hypothetical protein
MLTGGRVAATLGRGRARARRPPSADVAGAALVEAGAVAGAALGEAVGVAGAAAAVARIAAGVVDGAAANSCPQRSTRYGGRCSSWEL